MMICQHFENVEGQLGRVGVWSHKVEIGGKSSCVARPQFTKCGAPLQNDAKVKEALIVDVLESVILSNIEQSGISHATAALEVAG